MTNEQVASAKQKHYRVVGAGWSAAVAVLLLARGRHLVTWLRPTLDLDGMPRPFPPHSHPGWVEFITFWSLAEPWQTFGGRVEHPWSERRLTDLPHSRSLEGAGGAFRSRSTDPAWAWTEPADLPQFAETLMRLAVQQCKETHVVGDPLRFSRGTVRARGENYSGGEIAGTLYLEADEGWHWCNRLPLPRTIARCGVEGDASWWAGADGRALYLAGVLAPDLSAALGVGPRVVSGSRGTHRWSWVNSRRLLCHQIASPAEEPASQWFTRLKNRVSDLTGGAI